MVCDVPAAHMFLEYGIADHVERDHSDTSYCLLDSDAIAKFTASYDVTATEFMLLPESYVPETSAGGG